MAASTGIVAIVVALLVPLAAGVWPGPSTNDGVHLATLWSQESTGPDIGRFDFVWALEDETDIARYRAAGAARLSPAVLSRYVPFGIAAAGTGASNKAFANLSWWQANHPSWVLYQCDRKMPATYWGPGIGLDISNPAVVDWMLHAPAAEHSRSAAAIAAAGYDAISLDLFAFGNFFKACGRWESPTQWVDMYTPSWTDPGYKRDVLAWLKRFYGGLGGVAPGKRLLLVPNHASHVGQAAAGYWGSESWNSSETFVVGNFTDGILSEEGWTGYGGGLVGDVSWENKRLFQQNLAAHGKAYFSVNYWGPQNVRTHANVTNASFVAAEDYFLASHLVANHGNAAVYYGPNQCTYGASAAACTCGSWCQRDVFSRAITPAVGIPMGPATCSPPGGDSAGLWYREYSTGVALVNPSSNRTIAAQLDRTKTYHDRHGNAVDASTPWTLGPTSGAVFTTSGLSPAAPGPAVPAHMSVMTFYGMDLDRQAGWVNVWRGGIADCSNPNITAAAKMRVLLSLPHGVFTRSVSPPNSLYPGWKTVVRKFTSQVAPLLRNGKAMGVFIGDEIVCMGTPLGNFTAVADLLRAELGPAAWIYTNECSQMEQWPPIDPSTGTGGIPVSLSAISVDFYDNNNTDGAAEVAKNKRFYSNVLFPKLHPHQQALFVPGIFASSPEGCASQNISCPVDKQAEQIVIKLNGFFQWAKAEPRIAGFNPWHFRNRTTNQEPLPYDMKLGAVSMPTVVAKLKEIGHYIVGALDRDSGRDVVRT